MLAAFALAIVSYLHTPCCSCSQEFKSSDEVSLYIHTVTYPGLSYRRDLILSGIQDYLNSVNISNTLLMGDARLPHIHVMGELLLVASVKCWPWQQQL